MKTTFIFALLFAGLVTFAQRPGNEKVISWTVANQNLCWPLDDIGTGVSVALQVETVSMTNGFLKLYGKSGKASQWFQYGSGSFTQGSDSINIKTLVDRGLTSSGWAYDTPIFNNWQVCFYVGTDTVGTIILYETMVKK